MVSSSISKWLFALFFCCVSVASFAQKTTHKHECKLVCTVYDAKTKEALPQATVQLISHNKGKITDSKGKTEMLLKEGCICDCHLKISFVGYQDFLTKFKVTSDTSISIFLTENNELLEAVVVEGSSIKNDVKTLTVSKLSVDAMESHKGDAIANALEELSGVNTLRSGSAHISKPVIHGLYGNRILVQYNGVRMEGQQWGIQHAPELDGFLAEELAVVKGAGSVRYGADAMGGVVLVNPAELPTGGKLGGKANLVGMSNGRTVSGALMLEGGMGKLKGWGWRAQASTKKGGDLNTPDYQLTNTGVNELNYSFSVGKKAKNWGMELFYSHFGTEQGVLRATGSIGSLSDLEYAFGQQIPQGTAPFSYDISNPRQEAEHDVLKAKVYFDRPIGRVSLQYALQMNKRKEFDVRRGALNEIPSMNLEISTHTFDVDWEHNTKNGFSGNLGINAMYQDNNNIFGTQRSHFIPNFTAPSVGIYAIERWKKGELQLEGGLRYDFRQYDIKGWQQAEGFYSDAFSMQSITASFGAIYQLNDKQTLSTNIGTAWRPPHVSELFSYGKHQSNGSFEYGLLWDRSGTQPELQTFENANVGNEQSLKWVATYQYATEQTQVELTAYANWIQNYIYLRPEGIDFNSRTGILPLFGYTQGNAFFRGLDLQIQQKLGDYFTWNAQASHLKATDTDNEDSELPLIPANRVATGLRYQKDKLGELKDIFASVTVMHTFKQQNAPRVITVAELDAFRTQDIQPFELDSRNFDFMAAPEAYTLINLEAGFGLSVAKSEVDVRLGVRNLLNTSYRDYTNRLRYFADDLGRNFTLSLQYAF